MNCNVLVCTRISEQRETQSKKPQSLCTGGGHTQKVGATRDQWRNLEAAARGPEEFTHVGVG